MPYGFCPNHGRAGYRIVRVPRLYKTVCKPVHKKAVEYDVDQII